MSVTIGGSNQIVKQVVSVNKTDAFSGSGTWVSITGLSATITPSSPSSKVLVIVSFGAVGISTNSWISKVQRNGTDLNIADAAGSRPRSTMRTMRISSDYNHAQGGLSYQFVDSPSSTSALTYQVLGWAEGQSTFYINRTINDTDATEAYTTRQVSNITLIEISGS
jgi:hypothetical protein